METLDACNNAIARHGADDDLLAFLASRAVRHAKCTSHCAVRRESRKNAAEIEGRWEKGGGEKRKSETNVTESPAFRFALRANTLSFTAEGRASFLAYLHAGLFTGSSPAIN